MICWYGSRQHAGRHSFLFRAVRGSTRRRMHQQPTTGSPYSPEHRQCVPALRLCSFFPAGDFYNSASSLLSILSLFHLTQHLRQQPCFTQLLATSLLSSVQLCILLCKSLCSAIHRDISTVHQSQQTWSSRGFGLGLYLQSIRSVGPCS